MLTEDRPPFVHGRLCDNLITKIFKVDIQGNDVFSAGEKRKLTMITHCK